MSKVEVKNKLLRIIREMLLAHIDNEDLIPQEICDFILEKHCWTISDKSYCSDNLNIFVKTLQKWIEDSHPLIDEVNKSDVEIDYNFCEVYKKYIEVESEYCRVTFELVKLLEEALQEKEKYSNNFKNLCKFEENNMGILAAKSKFLKLQFFLKLYGEDNALTGHISLQSKLQSELQSLKNTYKQAVEVNKEYDMIKNDKHFCELFMVYKELKRIEKTTEIIGNERVQFGDLMGDYEGGDYDIGVGGVDEDDDVGVGGVDEDDITNKRTQK